MVLVKSEAGMSECPSVGGMSTASSSFMGSVPVVDLDELAEATGNWDIR